MRLNSFVVILLLMLFAFPSFSALKPPPPPKKEPSPYHWVNCVDLEPEFSPLKAEKFDVPANSEYTRCFRMTGHNDSVVLITQRFYLNDVDNIQVFVANDKNSPYEAYRKINFNNVNSEVMNASKIAGGDSDDEIRVVVKFSPHSAERELVISYGMSTEGTGLLTLGVASNGGEQTQGDEYKGPSTYHMDFSNQDGIQSINSELERYDISRYNRNSEQFECSPGEVPPEGISDNEPLNSALLPVEAHNLSLYVEDDLARKVIGEVVGSTEDRALRMAAATTAYIKSKSYNKKEHRSFYLGAAEKVAGHLSVNSMLDSLSGDVDINAYNNGVSYGSRFLNDPIRYEYIDSCSKEKIHDTGVCISREFKFRFTGMTANRWYYRKFPYYFGERVNLHVSANLYSFPDRIKADSLGGSERNITELYYSPGYMKGIVAHLFSVSDHSDNKHGPIQFWAIPMKGVGVSAAEISVKCTPIEW
ncbi:hypothetical protein [Ferrimonas kyonanensis]|uniref:hypothetical protein n=1 Tax=Ferrimonas kyonanensis TaxID=364763 RepID=UPI000416A862|nr:hypothetical protein [Ferrimonas kyonanensis]